MKKKEFNQLKEKTIEELKELLGKMRAESLKLKMEIKRGKIKNVHAHYSKRKEIAQVKSLISERSFGLKEKEK